jgi:general secretion pathway protein N
MMQRFFKSALIRVAVATLTLWGILAPRPGLVNAAGQPEEPPMSLRRAAQPIPAEATGTTASAIDGDLTLPRTRANPLWSLPLTALSATREMPLFSSSRRPLQTPPAPISTATVATAAPERPQLSVSLVGAIAGNNEGIAIFVDRTSKDIIRLKTGETYSGWTLQTVKGREATLERDTEKTILFLNPPAK